MSDEITQILSSLHPLERKVLAVFQNRTRTGEDTLLAASGLDESRLSMAMGWLLAKGLLSATEAGIEKTATVTELGRQYLKEGLPGLQIVKQLKGGEPVTVTHLRNIMEPGEVSKTIGALKEKDLIRIGPGGVVEVIDPGIENSEVAVRWQYLEYMIRAVINNPDEGKFEGAQKQSQELFIEYASGRGKKGIFDIHEKRKQIYGLTDLGQRLIEHLSSETAVGEEIAQITPDLLKDGAWRTKQFRKYNIALPAPRIAIGRRHPYREFLDGMKQKLLAMGFEEMRGALVESEFWNMDALYMPQFHPARDIHDVYFLKDPAYGRGAEAGVEGKFVEQVAAAHSTGGTTGSRGWRYPFDLTRAGRLMLRSQGTAVSARTLASKPKVPGKYFSIARCFRYEQVDATHAQDFFQIEGIVLGEGIHFRSLLGLLKLFAEEVARAREVKFLPAYFPFTEPSVELHIKHPRLGWMELGGAGLFRPEVTIPLGVSVPVIAWGLGLDRMAMMALGIHDIRDLFAQDIDKIRTMRPEGGTV